MGQSAQYFAFVIYIYIYILTFCFEATLSLEDSQPVDDDVEVMEAMCAFHVMLMYHPFCG